MKPFTPKYQKPPYFQGSTLDSRWFIYASLALLIWLSSYFFIVIDWSLMLTTAPLDTTTQEGTSCSTADSYSFNFLFFFAFTCAALANLLFLLALLAVFLRGEGNLALISATISTILLMTAGILSYTTILRSQHAGDYASWYVLWMVGTLFMLLATITEKIDSHKNSSKKTHLPSAELPINTKGSSIPRLTILEIVLLTVCFFISFKSTEIRHSFQAAAERYQEQHPKRAELIEPDNTLNTCNDQPSSETP